MLPYCLFQIGCAKESSSPDSTTSGRGTVNVSGTLNSVRNFGGTEKGTGVACIRNPGISFSEIILKVEGQSKFRVDSSEALHITFASADYPMGHVNFNVGSQVSYTIAQEAYGNGSNGNDCYANLSPVGSTSLSGIISCKNMLGQDGRFIDVSARFECTVKTLQ